MEFMKVIGKTIKKIHLDQYFLIMEIRIKANGKMINLMEMVFFKL